MRGDPACRGWILADVLRYCSPTQAIRVIEQSSSELRAFWSRPEGRRLEWIPVEQVVEAMSVVDRVAGDGDGSLGWPIGSFLASREGGPVMALAARFLRPSTIVSLAPGLWSTHFRDTGRVIAHGRGDHDMVIRLVGFPVKSPILCQAIGGWMQGFLRLGPRRDIRVAHVSCAATGASTCEFSAAWVDDSRAVGVSSMPPPAVRPGIRRHG